MICISHLTALDAEPELMVEAAAKAGFDGLGLRIFPPSHAPDQYPIVGDWPRIRRLRAMADDLGVRIFEAESFGIDKDFAPDPCARALEAAAALGRGWWSRPGSTRTPAGSPRIIAGWRRRRPGRAC